MAEQLSVLPPPSAPRQSGEIRKAWTRTKLITVATELFRQAGVRATSIDEIVAAAQVTKPTLYRHFPSKNDLVIACLQAEEERVHAELSKLAQTMPAGPAERMRAIGRYFAESFKAEPRRGLFAINLAVEYSDPSCPVARAIQEEVEGFQEHLAMLITPKGPDRAAHAARQLALAIFGASAACQAVGENASLCLSECVETIIAATGLG